MREQEREEEKESASVPEKLQRQQLALSTPLRVYL